MSAAPLILNAKGIAALMGRSQPWFYQHRPDLERAGFPKKDRLIGGWHRTAVEDWLAHRAGTVAELAADAERREMREAIRAQRTRRDAIRHQPAR